MPPLSFLITACTGHILTHLVQLPNVQMNISDSNEPFLDKKVLIACLVIKNIEKYLWSLHDWWNVTPIQTYYHAGWKQDYVIISTFL